MSLLRKLYTQCNISTYLLSRKCIPIKQQYSSLFTTSNLKSEKSSQNKFNYPILTFYTKDQCSLCDDLMEELAPFLDRVRYKLDYS